MVAVMGQETRKLIDSLKLLLRERGISYRELAGQMQVSESSVKRWFASGQISLKRFEELCRASDCSVLDLAAKANSLSYGGPTQLSLKQEEILCSEKRLFFFFWQLVLGVPIGKIRQRYGLSATLTERYMLKLDRAKLISLGARLKFKLLVPRDIYWHSDGPIEKMILKEWIPGFLDDPFRQATAHRHVFFVKLPRASYLRYIEKMRKLAKEIINEGLEEQFSKSTRDTACVLFAIRPYSWLQKS